MNAQMSVSLATLVQIIISPRTLGISSPTISGSSSSRANEITSVTLSLSR